MSSSSFFGKLSQRATQTEATAAAASQKQLCWMARFTSVFLAFSISFMDDEEAFSVNLVFASIIKWMDITRRCFINVPSCVAHCWEYSWTRPWKRLLMEAGETSLPDPDSRLKLPGSNAFSDFLFQVGD